MASANAWSHVMRALAAGAFVVLSYIVLSNIHQPLVDIHAFRQTQTALTAYWFLQEGLSLAYQTPVAGSPWSIPFEFPIYQALVAAAVSVTGIELEAAGRLLSYLFLVACAWPAFALARRLDLPGNVPWVFCVLLWTSPLCMYWGRTFMIETAAVFFALASLPYALDLGRHMGGWRSALLFLVLATAGVLQKATTVGPVLLFLLLATSVTHVRSGGLRMSTFKALLGPLVLIGLPLAVGLAWAHYADLVKAANPFGSQLTSKAIADWNFGSLKQRLAWDTWQLVLWQRSVKLNAGGLLGAVLLLAPWLAGRAHRRFAWLSTTALILWVLPVLVFTNLHVVHEYYQVACLPFLLAALALAIGGWLEQASGIKALTVVATLAIVASNLFGFRSNYAGIVMASSVDELDAHSVQAFKVGRYLREHTPTRTALAIFGQDYSSEIGFQAQRKSITVPAWFKEYRELWQDPQKYLGELPLSAIVICPVTDAFPTLADLLDRGAREPGWTHRSVYGCELWLSPISSRRP